MSKVVYLIEQPLDDRNYERFGIQNWIDRGWNIEVWDLTQLSHPRVWQERVKSETKFDEFECCFPIASCQQLEQRYAALEKIDYFIDFIGDGYFSLRVKRRLVRMGAVRVICSIGSIPVPDNGQKSGFVSKISKAFAVGPTKSFKLLTNALMWKLMAPPIRPGIMVVSGEKSIPAFIAGRDHKIIRAHNFDYDIYLKAKKSFHSSTEEFAVFIDQDYCFHPEYIYQNARSVLTPEKYFPAVCNALRRIAHSLRVDLRIAAHPRSAYQQRVPNYFEEIRIEYGKTAELIRNCKVVICHDSTAIQFAVLFGKPVIFLTTDELNSVFLDSSFKSKSIESFAFALGKSVINLDRDLAGVNWQDELSIDTRKYDEYRNRYIKIDGSPENTYWDIVIDHMEKQDVQRSNDEAG